MPHSYCRGCERTFSGLSVYDKHHTITGGNSLADPLIQHCREESELEDMGIVRKSSGQNTVFGMESSGDFSWTKSA